MIMWAAFNKLTPHQHTFTQYSLHTAANTVSFLQKYHIFCLLTFLHETKGSKEKCFFKTVPWEHFVYADVRDVCIYTTICMAITEELSLSRSCLFSSKCYLGQGFFVVSLFNFG